MINHPVKDAIPNLGERTFLFREVVIEITAVDGGLG
jgi:hypothetical protein